MFASSEQWIEVRSDHFTVITDSSDKQARHILDQFERMRWMFQTLFPQANPDPAAPIVVIAAKNEKTFDAMEPEAYLARGQLKLGGYFIHGVKCSYPSVIEFKVDGANKSVSLYSNDYYKLEFTALGFQPSDDLHPCDDIEGMKARVQYAESSDKTVDGQVVSVELRK